MLSCFFPLIEYFLLGSSSIQKPLLVPFFLMECLAKLANHELQEGFKALTFYSRELQTVTNFLIKDHLLYDFNFHLYVH